jgi:hypothetical protein
VVANSRLIRAGRLADEWLRREAALTLAERDHGFDALLDHRDFIVELKSKFATFGRPLSIATKRWRCTMRSPSARRF